MQEQNRRNAQGMDISHYQGNPDWDKIATYRKENPNFSFCFTKATQGTKFIDDKCTDHLTGARGAGLLIGVYHFLDASTAAAALQEADFFLSVVNGFGGMDILNFPLALDLENESNTEEAGLAFLERVEEQTGITPMLYTCPWIIDQRLKGGKLSRFPLWLATYSDAAPDDRGGWDRWTIKQYTDKGRVPGISGPVDLDEFEGSVEELVEALKPAPKATISKETADRIILTAKSHYALAVSDADREAWRKVGKETRHAAGLPEDYEPA